VKKEAKRAEEVLKVAPKSKKTKHGKDDALMDE